MLSQVGNLGTHYLEWVTSPVDRQLRLFKNPLLENLTITPWYIVPLVWLPVIAYMILNGTRHYMEVTNGMCKNYTSHGFRSIIFKIFSSIHYDQCYKNSYYLPVITNNTNNKS